MKCFGILEPNRVGWMDKPVPVPEGFDAVVKLIAVTPCTSDVHNFEMKAVAPGMTLGHEGIGEVATIGPFVKDIKIGDKVIIPAITPIWRTIERQAGIPQHSGGLFKGQMLANYKDGLFAEYSLINDADMNLIRIPEGVSDESAMMLSDMMATGFYGAEIANIEFGDTVVVLGIGPVGLMSIAGAKLRGAARIIGIGSRKKCIEIAKYYGATDIVNYKEGDITKQVYKLTDKKGADKCIIAGGGNNALNQAVSMIRWGGSIGNVNYFETYGDLPISNPRWGFGMGNKTIKNGMVPGGRLYIEKLTQLLKHDRIDPSKLITHKLYGIDKIEEAFKMMSEKPDDLIKVAVWI